MVSMRMGAKMDEEKLEALVKQVAKASGGRVISN
jgi:hypothetical protein